MLVIINSQRDTWVASLKKTFSSICSTYSNIIYSFSKKKLKNFENKAEKFLYIKQKRAHINLRITGFKNLWAEHCKSKLMANTLTKKINNLY